MRFHVVLCLLLLSYAGASGTQMPDGQDLIAKAADKMNIFALPRFEMKGIVRIDNQGKPAEGSYLLLWNGPDQWREEISFPGYNEIRLGGKGSLSVKRSMALVPLRIDQLHRALGFGSDDSNSRGSFVYQAPRMYEEVKKVKSKKINGSKVDCVEIADKENKKREVCVDSSTGTLVRQEPFLDKQLKSIGPKVFPSILSYTENGQAVAEIHVTDLRTT